MNDEKQEPTADPIKQRAAEIVKALHPVLQAVAVYEAVEHALREGMAMRVPDEMPFDPGHNHATIAYRHGWNACRAAMKLSAPSTEPLNSDATWPYDLARP